MQDCHKIVYNKAIRIFKDKESVFKAVIIVYINIAICDDEREICDYLESALTRILKEKSIHFNIDCYANGEELCEEMKYVSYDLIFLDIELPNINGIGVAKYIRKQLHNEIIQIAYISSKSQYALDLFEARPINFLVKPLSDDELEKIIDTFTLITNNDNKIFTFKFGRTYKKILLSDILYFSSSGRKITIITQTGQFEYYDSLENIYSQTKDCNFLYIHKSFIVNYRFIKIYKYESVIMANDKEIPISQSHRKAIRTAFLELKNKEL